MSPCRRHRLARLGFTNQSRGRIERFLRMTIGFAYHCTSALAIKFPEEPFFFPFSIIPLATIPASVFLEKSSANMGATFFIEKADKIATFGALDSFGQHFFTDFFRGSPCPKSPLWMATLMSSFTYKCGEKPKSSEVSSLRLSPAFSPSRTQDSRLAIDRRDDKAGDGSGRPSRRLPGSIVVNTCLACH